MALRIGHDGDDAFVVVVTFAGKSPAQNGYEFDCIIDVVNGDIELDTILAHLRLGNRLKHDPGLGIVARTEIYPPFLRWAGVAPKQRAQNRATRCGSRQSNVTPDHLVGITRPYDVLVGANRPLVSEARRDRNAIIHWRLIMGSSGI